MSEKHTAIVQPKCFAVTKDEKGEDRRLGYSGTVTMRIPTWMEKRELMEGFGVQTADEAAAAIENAMETHRKMTKYLVTKVAAFVVAVDITRDDDKRKIDNWDDVAYESPLASTLITEMSWWVINGKHRLPGPSSPS